MPRGNGSRTPRRGSRGPRREGIFRFPIPMDAISAGAFENGDCAASQIPSGSASTCATADEEEIVRAPVAKKNAARTEHGFSFFHIPDE